MKWCKRSDKRNLKSEETRIYKKTEVSSKSERSKSKKKHWGKLVLTVSLGVVLFIGGMLVGMYTYLRGYSTGYPPSSELPLVDESTSRMNILVLGIDGGVDGQLLTHSKTGTRSDVIMLVSIDTNGKKMDILSIPRDTRVFIPKVNNLEKAGHAHAYGGPELVIQTIEEFLDVEIHRYVRADFEGFRQIINTMGGVYIDVPEDMNYKDPYQDLYIHIEAGPQELDGEKALHFVRYRDYVDGDIGRIRAQELFLKALADKVMRIATITKIPKLISDVLPYVLTDLTNEDLMYLASIGLNIKPNEVRMSILPGESGYIGDISYWLIDSTKTAQMVDEVVRGIDRTKNAEIKVTVHNGCGTPGAADYIASILRSYGFDVIEVGNADKFDYNETMVLAPKGKQDIQTELLKSIRAVAVESKAYTSDEIPENSDVLVILGKDIEMSQ